MKRIAVFPGTFDPITIGHVDIIQRALQVFDEVIIAIGINAAKQTMFPLELRMEWISNSFSKNEKIKVMHFEGLTAEFCKQQNAGFIIRGLRNGTDFDYEAAIARINLDGGSIETVSFISKPEHVAITSTIVRDILRNKGNASKYLAEGVIIKS